jgi:hypothetical protein
MLSALSAIVCCWLMSYLDQSIYSIRLFLVEGDPDLEQFTKLAHSSVVWGAFRVEFGILGESHFVSIWCGDKQITEICACTDATFDTEKSVLVANSFLHTLSDIPVMHEWKEGNLEYSFEYQHFGYTQGLELLSDLRAVKKVRDTFYLQYTFPSPWFSFKKPVTEVFIREDTNAIFIRTVHTYPNDKQVALTQSMFRIL